MQVASIPCEDGSTAQTAGSENRGQPWVPGRPEVLIIGNDGETRFEEHRTLRGVKFFKDRDIGDRRTDPVLIAQTEQGKKIGLS